MPKSKVSVSESEESEAEDSSLNSESETSESYTGSDVSDSDGSYSESEGSTEVSSSASERSGVSRSTASLKSGKKPQMQALIPVNSKTAVQKLPPKTITISDQVSELSKVSPRGGPSGMQRTASQSDNKVVGAQSVQAMSQYFSKYRAKSVKEMVAERTGQPFAIDESWKTSVAIDGMQVETMARKRWKWAVTQILEQQAAAKEAQLQWVKIAEDARKKKFRARGWQLAVFLSAIIEVILGLIFFIIPDSRRDNAIFRSRQIQILINVQLLIAVVCFVVNIAIATQLKKLLDQDPSLRHASMSWMVLTKCAMLVAYMCVAGYPTQFRAGMIAILVISSVFQIFASLVIMWVYQFSTLLKQPSTIPSILRALLSLRQHVSAKNSPMTVGLIDNLLQWLGRTKGRSTSIPGGHNFHYVGLLVLVLLFSMSITAIISIRTFQPAIVPDESLDDITAESNVFDNIISGEPYFWNSTGRFDHTIGGAKRRLLLVVLTGVRYDVFKQNLNFLSSEVQEDGVLFKSKTFIPSTSVTNWLGLISGVKPETSGYLGHAVPKVCHFDTVFHQAQKFAMKVGVAVTPWMSAFIQTALEPFVGISVVGPDYLETEYIYDRSKVLEYDDDRHTSLLSALGDLEPYDLFMAQYLHPAVVAHVDGYLASQTESSSYSEAVIRVMTRLQEVASILPLNTVMMVTSDHGELKAPHGGTGGSDAQNVDVPLWVFKKDWHMEAGFPSAEGVPQLSNENFAATASMILGLPTPRQNQGVFWEPLSPLVYDPASYEYHWKDLVIQTAIFSNYYLQLNLGSASSTQQKVNEFLERAVGDPVLENLQQVHADLMKYVLDKRDSFRNTTSARNVGVTFILAILIFGFTVFVMEVMTLSDPFVIFSSLIKTPSEYFANGDVRALIQAFCICILHYILSFVAFYAAFAIYGYSKIDMTLLMAPGLLTLYLVGALVPSAISFHILQRIVILKYHRSEDIRPSRKRLTRLWQNINKYLDILVFYPLAFKDFEMAYLSRVYGMLMACFFSLIFILGLSKYVFIIPFVFLDQFIEEDDWQNRFSLVTLVLFSIPMLLLSVWNMMSWSQQKLNADSYHSLEERRQAKEKRLKAVRSTASDLIEVEEKSEYKSRALQKGSKYAGIATKRRPNPTPDMFDTLQDEIAENEAEIHVLRRQIAEIDSSISDSVGHDERATRQRLQISNDDVSKSLEDMYNQLKQKVPPHELPVAEYQSLKDEINKGEQDLAEVEDMVLDHIKMRMNEIDETSVPRDKIEKLKRLFGEDFHLGSGNHAKDRPEMAAHEKFVELQRKFERAKIEKEKLENRISFYDDHFKTVKVKREEELNQLNTIFEDVLRGNEKLKNQIVSMIGERNNLLQTLKELKTKRTGVNQLYKQEIFHMESKEEHLQEESDLLNEEFELIEQEKEVLFREVAQISAELERERNKLKVVRTEVEKYRKLLAQMIT